MTAALERDVSDAGLVIGTVAEALALKKQILNNIGRHSPGDCIVTSNMSSLVPTGRTDR